MRSDCPTPGLASLHVPCVLGPDLEGSDGGSQLPAWGTEACVYWDQVRGLYENTEPCRAHPCLCEEIDMGPQKNHLFQNSPLVSQEVLEGGLGSGSLWALQCSSLPFSAGLSHLGPPILGCLGLLKAIPVLCPGPLHLYYVMSLTQRRCLWPSRCKPSSEARFLGSYFCCPMSSHPFMPCCWISFSLGFST